jgi:hypothetical protein
MAGDLNAIGAILKKKRHKDEDGNSNNSQGSDQSEPMFFPSQASEPEFDSTMNRSFRFEKQFTLKEGEFKLS